MFQPVVDFFAEFDEQFRVLLLPLSGRRRAADLPNLKRAFTDSIILTQRPKIVAFLEGLLDTGLQVFETAYDSRDRILGPWVAHLIHYACFVHARIACDFNDGMWIQPAD
jgi:hypothetical protein